MTNSWQFLCRAGWESVLVRELEESCGRFGVRGEARRLLRGCVQLDVDGSGDAASPWRRFPVDDLVFARQGFWVWSELTDVPDASEQVLDRLAELRGTPGQPGSFSSVVVECPDSEEGKPLWPRCRALQESLGSSFRERGWFAAGRRGAEPRLHVLLLPDAGVSIGLAAPGCSSPYPMGIRRLKARRDAPSRSALKLEEALLQFIPEEDRGRRLKPGMRAVDLGAAPGGWSHVLARHGLVVAAVDNGPMDKTLLATGLVEQQRADGFTYRPRKPVDWLVCDMVAPPTRVARLIAIWGSKGLCGEAIFNLKLPNRDSWKELTRCRGMIKSALRQAGASGRLRFKHLYHDRDEVTGHLQLLARFRAESKRAGQKPALRAGPPGRAGARGGRRKR